MKPISKVRLSGGPSLHSIRVTDAETGQELHVRSFEICAVRWDGTHPRPLTVKLEMAAELEIVGETPQIYITNVDGAVYDAAAGVWRRDGQVPVVGDEGKPE